MAARKSRRMTTPARRTRTTGSGRRRVIALAGAGDTVTALGVTQPVAAASATPAGLPPGCTQSESTVACVYMTTGAAQTFTPSAGVSSAMAILTGASGGTGGAFPDLVDDPGGPGGLGATVTGAVSGTLSAHWPAGQSGPDGGAGDGGGLRGGNGELGGAIGWGGGGGSDLVPVGGIVRGRRQHWCRGRSLSPTPHPWSASRARSRPGWRWPGRCVCPARPWTRL